MAFVENESSNYNLWDYILGSIYQKPDKFNDIYNDGKYGLSIACNRYYYLEKLDNISKLKISCRDPSNNYWTKWIAFPGLLWNNNEFGSSGLTAAVDVHRSVLPNEIVIESDYPTYEENYEASRIIGAILEHKGFIPHYYYSGNKSVHIHIFLDWNILNIVYWDELENKVKEVKESIYSPRDFKKNFIDWLRKKMISCWDMKARDFDEDLIRASHLIRAELSKNKKGFKTFLGYTHRDMSFVPYVCNEQNRIYPRLGEIRLSQPHCIKELIEEFQESREIKSKIRKIQKKNKPLNKWVRSTNKTELRDCVKSIMSDDFAKVNDGFKRGMFYLVNELREVFGDDQARIIIKDWNDRMGNPIKQSEIDYRFKIKHYTMTCEKIHKFLAEVGIKINGKCKHKL